MKNSGLLWLIILIVLFGSSPSYAQKKSSMMKPTSTSEKAVDLYQQSITAAENAEIKKSISFMNEALTEDPNLFIAHAQYALFALQNNNREMFDKHAKRALEHDDNLTEAEKLIKTSLKHLLENPEADVTEMGKKIVKLHPSDRHAYYILATFQAQHEDYKGAINTYKKGIKAVDNPAPFYNMLGYTYMSDGNMKEAEKAFDKYIELNPDHPNPYDSKGDFYMENEQYKEAYENYMKAHSINSEWSYEKAEKAKEKMNP